MNCFNELPAHVWPRNAQRQDDGVVTIAGVALPQLAEDYATPVMVIDEDDFRSRCRDMARAFGRPEFVHYASKSLLTRTIARWVDEEGLSLDVASEFELDIALRADFPAERITAHGNNKSDRFLRDCVRHQVGQVVLDHPDEIVTLDSLARRYNVVQPVLVRVTPGVEAHTNEMIATAHEDQKFGFSVASGAAWDAVRAAHNAENLDLVGLHCHIGSQVFDADGFKLAAERVLALYSRLHSEAGVTLPKLDLGGGYGIAYVDDQSPLDIDALAASLLAAVDKTAAELGIEPPIVLAEPGRAISGPAAVTVYTVGAVKDTQVGPHSWRRYVAVDGGMSDNIRPALYDAEYDGRLVNRFTEGEELPSRIVGSHCESGDVLINHIDLPDDVQAGDYFAMPGTGAYCQPMSSNYNAQPKPAIVSVRGGRATLMLRRETVDDFLAREA
ncbi:diaminopimelate decarboxylase [Corynebacterium uterequi]|uniref:Diaminopimelate decarboxylase n=1 Tax=Corynebacterium uterequi TaxID=1072256 RepID=A0A0G3HDS8_9CORY|nr:diaminopimelate decarboxylase [Corynebacterium uterequi]AKK10870.1 diaminopimelate decarboxylase [Corynebacterium uterequi]